MGRGDRRKVRWAHDREGKKKEREQRAGKAKGAERKKAARAAR
jgi:hypothetical protein